MHVMDPDKDALARMKQEIYPSRYGSWDASIKLHSAMPDPESWDAVIIGTPPDTHIRVAINVLKATRVKVLLIEKPLTVPKCEERKLLDDLLADSQTRCLVGFNHNVADSTNLVVDLIEKGVVGAARTLEVSWLESWAGIFAAHPWLDGPADSYLGYQARGGGACCEHSHGIALWLHLAEVLNIKGRLDIQAANRMVSKGGVCYDEETFTVLSAGSSVIGVIKQDVMTYPASKVARITGSSGYVEWFANVDGVKDVVRWARTGAEQKTVEFPKTRPDDFKNEIAMIEAAVLNPAIDCSPIAYTLGSKVSELTNNIIESAQAGSRQHIYLG